MNPDHKRPAYLFAKDFKFENVLGNLQGYKIATGQVEKGEFEELSKRYGSDEGAVFGSLITQAAGKSQPEVEGGPSPTKRRKRRRRRKQQKKEEEEEDYAKLSVTNEDLKNQEPLSVPASILAYGSSDSGSSDDDKHSKKSTSTSEEESTEEETGGPKDFFGLTEEGGEEEEESTDLSPPTITTSGDETVNVLTNDEGHRYGREYSSSQEICKTQEAERQEWDAVKRKYKEEVSELSSFKCWKCRRIGHLAEDCTVRLGGSATAGPSRCTTGDTSLLQNDESSSDTTALKDYFKRCQALRRSRHAMCSECGGRSNLASCLECGLTFCDGRGHLTDHLMNYPSHTILYSFKLKKLIKCHKPTCAVVDVSKLLMCASCLGKQFDGHYNMINATWSRSGLKGIPSTLACEQHFHWHRMNCGISSEELLVTPEKLELAKQRGDGLLSEFYF